ncbi:hypothetical protein H5410_017507 [Solanum commersonii]|uniref:Uncharacterized protein n=1 Tax=Solanum commersonii TaxID=4109 RepID=A0A9J6A056_SOLCO|nr:hypothetical protein H5410_017507 [Solanum commersonii]
MKDTISSNNLWCGLNYHINGSEPVPDKFIVDNHLNPAYKAWVRQNQHVLSWIVASVSKSVLP